MEQAVAIQDKQPLPAFTMTPRTLDEALKYAEMMSNSDLVPSGYKGKPGNILVAIQKGLEVGLSPMAALETIAVINGRASLWGDGMLALVQAHPAYEAIDEGQSSDKEGVCRVKRKGEAWYEQRFTLEDAKRAGLLGKPGPWTAYTKRMLQLRARGFALRDKFADALKGMIAAEEAMDTVSIQAEVAATPEPSLKEKLKAQIEHQPVGDKAQGGHEGNDMVQGTSPKIAHPEPPTQTDLLLAYRDQYREASTGNALSEVGNAMEADPDLSVENKKVLRADYRQRLGELGKKK